MKKKKSFLQKAVSAATAFAVMLVLGVLLDGNTMRAEAACTTTAEVTAYIDNLKATKYTEGISWDNFYTDAQSSAKYRGIECVGFARHVGELLFGTFPGPGITSASTGDKQNGWVCYKGSDVTSVQPGDIIHTAEHAAVVHYVSGSKIYVIEAWGSMDSEIHYGYFNNDYSTLSSIKSNFTFYGIWRYGSVKNSDAIKLSSISVTTAPNTTIYEDGSTFSTAGMVVTAKYSDGSSKAVTGYTTSADLSTTGTKNVTISYTESGVTKTTTQSVTVQDLFAGSGTASDPYKIGTASDLQALADNVNDISANGCYGYAYYIQTADIDLSGIDWIPIGTYYESLESETLSKFAAFNGCYNGNYHKVTNLYVNYSKQYSGLFGRVNYNVLTSAVVENLSVSGTVIGGNPCAGGIAGETGYSATIRNCDFTGTVQGTNLVGGITGKLQGGANISNCYANAELTATDDGGKAGGITGGILVGNVASSVDALVENSYFAGTISADQNGGVSGMLEIDTVKECTATFTNNYYLNTASSGAVAGAAQTGCSSLSPTLLKESASMLGAVYTNAAAGQNDGYPVFVWQNAPFTGSGTESDPYQISSKEELEKMRDLVNDTAMNPTFGRAYYIQTADIDLENENWVPIGLGYDGDDGQGAYNYTTRVFNGTYDGNQFNIYNLNVDGNWKVGGLFAFVRSGPIRRASATIKNLVVYGNIKTTGQSGGIVGQLQWYGTIENCAFIGDVTGAGYAGGITASAWAGDTITSCYHMGNVTSEGTSGGIAGTVRFSADNSNGDASNITNCYHAGGNVTGPTYSGGIIGNVVYQDSVSNTITVDNCYFLSGTAANTTNPDATADNTLALTESLMKKIAGDLGAPYADNTNPALNDGFPVFEWQLIVKGDANTDGTVSVPDIAALQKHILTISALNSEQCENADMNADGVVDAFDLAILKAVLLRK